MQKMNLFVDNILVVNRYNNWVNYLEREEERFCRVKKEKRVKNLE